MKRLIGLVVFFAWMHGGYSQGRVGIGTAHPQAKLHIAGNVIIDTVRLVNDAHSVLTRDTLGVVNSLPISVLKQLLVVNPDTGLVDTDTLHYISQEVIAQASTTSNVAQSRVVVVLTPGVYLLSAYAEVFNTAAVGGVRMWLFEGVTEIGYGAPYSNTTTYSSWTSFRVCTITTATTITLSYSSWPGGTTSFIRRARLVAIKLA